MVTEDKVGSVGKKESCQGWAVQVQFQIGWSGEGSFQGRDRGCWSEFQAEEKATTNPLVEIEVGEGESYGGLTSKVWIKCESHFNPQEVEIELGKSD